MLVVVDTNCLIDATRASALAYGAMRGILDAGDTGRVRLAVSLHSLSELEVRPDDALTLAQSLERLPYYPVGRIDDLLGPISGLSGTINDMKINSARIRDITDLANAGTDLRDQGAFLDAFLAGANVFLTSDGQMVATGPAARLGGKYPLRIMTPAAFAKEYLSLPLTEGG